MNGSSTPVRAVRLEFLMLAAVLTGCTAAGSSPAANPATPPPTSIPQVTSAPTPVPTSIVTPSPTADPDTVLVEAARAYAAAAGFDLDPAGPPAAQDAEPEFDEGPLRLVTLPLADAGGAVLSVYVDTTGAIRVVNDGLAFIRKTGANVSRSAAIAAAAEQFRLAGIDPADGTLTVAQGERGGEWYLVLERQIDGYPVANHPMWWGILGDHVYVTLRRDGTLVTLYAIRPPSVVAASILATDVLARELAAAAGLSEKQITALHPQLTWVRARDPQTGIAATGLTLNYCATSTFDRGWQAWCVDAGTGKLSLTDIAGD